MPWQWIGTGLFIAGSRGSDAMGIGASLDPPPPCGPGLVAHVGHGWAIAALPETDFRTLARPGQARARRKLVPPWGANPGLVN
jgi:hypothetical protein